MSYYVVALERGNPLLERSKFHQLGCKLVDESMKQVREEMLRTGTSSVLKKLERIEVYTFGEVMPGYEHRLSEWETFYLPAPEYEGFGKVYFLNEVAYRMYKDGGVEFEVSKIITDEELPKGCNRSLGADYLSKQE
jgi:hypothetical protein